MDGHQSADRGGRRLQVCCPRSPAVSTLRPPWPPQGGRKVPRDQEDWVPASCGGASFGRRVDISTRGPSHKEAIMFNTDPYLALRAFHQRSRRLREEAAADALARQVSRRDTPRRGGWRAPQRRRRAPTIL